MRGMPQLQGPPRGGACFFDAGPLPQRPIRRVVPKVELPAPAPCFRNLLFGPNLSRLSFGTDSHGLGSYRRLSCMWSFAASGLHSFWSGVTVAYVGACPSEAP